MIASNASSPRRKKLSVVGLNTSLPTAVQTLQRQAFRPTQLILVLAIGLFLLPVEIPFTVQLLPLLLSMLVLGLPHGAIDPLVPNLLRLHRLSWWQLTVVFTGYAALTGVVLGLWWLAPDIGFAFFILLTWWHWGTADLHALLAFDQVTFLNGRFRRVLTVAVRGGLPMLIPLLFFPGEYQLAASSIGRIFGAESIQSLDWAFTPTFRMGLAVGFGALLLMLFGLTYLSAARARQQSKWLAFAGETMLLALFFAIVPSFFAVGLYFCLWHSVRHIARLILVDQQAAGALAKGELPAAFGHFMKEAARAM